MFLLKIHQNFLYKHFVNVSSDEITYLPKLALITKVVKRAEHEGLRGEVTAQEIPYNFTQFFKFTDASCFTWDSLNNEVET